MPATMMHLLAGHALLPGGSDSFFLGCILPDCLDFDRDRKDLFHLRNVPPEERLQALIRLGQSLDLSLDFDFGVLCHLYLDYLWDNGPQKAHRMSYTGDLWFRDYRKELASAGNRGAHRFFWARPLWERLRRVDEALFENSMSLPVDEIKKFMEFNFHFHTEEHLPESEVFTDQVVDAFIRRADRAFRSFLQDFFPQVAKERSFA